MNVFLKLFFDICLLRKGPQDVPASPLLLGLAMICYVVAGWLFLSLEMDWIKAAVQVGFAAAILLLLVWATLTIAGKRHRLVQTVTALVGTDTVLTVLAVAVSGLTAVLPDLHIIVMIVLTLWDVLVIAHILHHALSRAFGYGLGLAVAYFIAIQQLLALLLGPGG